MPVQAKSKDIYHKETQSITKETRVLTFCSPSCPFVTFVVKVFVLFRLVQVRNMSCKDYAP
jgi:hypothetical protein